MIKVAMPIGTYVVAVSGGIDSMVLLDVLAKQPGLTLTVAHYDHGIRPDSALDRQLVEKICRRYELPFVYEEGRLGVGASEATARDARYAFLQRTREACGAQAIVTAHHQDDLVETVIINIMRGTGRKGLSSLQSSADIVRPLLEVTKADIRDYAATYPDILWREDSTNADDRYLRNYIRQAIVPRLGVAGKQQLLDYAAKASQANPLIDTLLMRDIAQHTTEEGLERSWFIGLPYDVSCEVMAAWLRSGGIREFDQGLIQQLVIAAKTAQPGKQRDINAGYWLKTGKATVRIIPRSTS